MLASEKQTNRKEEGTPGRLQCGVTASSQDRLNQEELSGSGGGDGAFRDEH